MTVNDLKMAGHQQSSVAFHLTVTNSFADSGVAANNSITCNDGFHLRIKPRNGDLFGTTFRTQVPQFREVSHTWAAEDRGPAAAGYSNNVAIGRLVIDAASTSFLNFSGAGSSNALYVDFLELRGAATNGVQSLFAIDTNLVIYFADANVTAETLDGLFADAQKPNGRLRWVKDFAGPNSSVDVLLLNGTTIQVNRALRNSLTIDSDGDGVPNGLDFYPFDAAVWVSLSLGNLAGQPSPMLSWSPSSATVYEVEYKTNLGQSAWLPLLRYTNTVPGGLISILDSNGISSDLQRFYRVRLGQ